MKRLLSLPPGSTAALFIDLQEEHRQDPRYLVEGYDAVLANVSRLQAAARGQGVPVIHCAYVVDPAAEANRPFHPMEGGKSVFSDKDDPRSAICPEVAPATGEPLIVKSRASAFSEGSLEAFLRSAAVEWLVVSGVWTEACVDATVKDAIDRGFRVLLVKDACGTATQDMHRMGVLNLANRLYGGAVVDTGRACRLLRGETVEAWQVQGAVPLRITFANAADLFDAL